MISRQCDYWDVGDTCHYFGIATSKHYVISSFAPDLVSFIKASESITIFILILHVEFNKFVRAGWKGKR